MTLYRFYGSLTLWGILAITAQLNVHWFAFCASEYLKKHYYSLQAIARSQIPCFTFPTALKDLWEMRRKAFFSLSLFFFLLTAPLQPPSHSFLFFNSLLHLINTVGKKELMGLLIWQIKLHELFFLPTG